MFGLSAFIRDGDAIYRTYFTSNRGVEALGPRLDPPRPDRVRPAGGVGGLARGLPADSAVPVVAPPRRVRRLEATEAV